MGFSAFLAKPLVEVGTVSSSQSVTNLKNDLPISGLLEQLSLGSHATAKYSAQLCVPYS